MPELTARRVNGNGKHGGLMVISDYPTDQDFRAGQVPSGTPRRLIEQLIKSTGYSGPIYWTAAYKEVLPYDKPPTATVWWKHREELLREVIKVKPERILCLGPIGYSSLMRATKNLPITKNRGRLSKINGAPCLCTYTPWQVIKDVDLFRDLARDVAKLLEATDIHRVKLAKYSCPVDKTEALELIAEMTHKGKYQSLVCDLETTGVNPRANQIESIGLGVEMISGFWALIIPRTLVYDEDIKASISNLFGSAAGTIMHNAKFDLAFLERYMGKPVQCKAIDTMLMNYALDERPTGRYKAHSLKTCAQIRFDATDYAVDFDEFYGKPEEERDYDGLYRYQALDLYYTSKLYTSLQEDISAEAPSLRQLCDTILFPAAQVFSAVENFGIRLDMDYLQGKSDEYRDRIDGLTNILKMQVGDPEFNPLSPQQVVEVLQNRFKVTVPKSASASRGDRHNFLDQDNSGEGSSRKDALEALVLSHSGLVGDFARNVVDLRKMVKLNNTYFEGLLSRAHEGRIHPDFRLHGSATGRLSCSNPNVQNIPARIDGKSSNIVKNAFIADDGHILVQADYSQLELRVLCYLCGDPNLAAIFADPTLDMHKMIASDFFGKPVGEISKAERQLAKSVVFGVVYGRGPQALVEGFEMQDYVKSGGKQMTLTQAKDFIEHLYDMFPGMGTWIQQIQSQTLKSQYVESLFGRRRRFPLVLQQPSHMASIKRQAVNTPIQSAASDMCLSALLRMHHKYQDKFQVLLSVHDSILVQCAEGLQEEVVKIMQWEMAENHGLEDRVRFEAKAEVGYKWGELKEV